MSIVLVVKYSLDYMNYTRIFLIRVSILLCTLHTHQRRAVLLVLLWRRRRAVCLESLGDDVDLHARLLVLGTGEEHTATERLT